MRGIGKMMNYGVMVNYTDKIIRYYTKVSLLMVNLMEKEFYIMIITHRIMELVVIVYSQDIVNSKYLIIDILI